MEFHKEIITLLGEDEVRDILQRVYIEIKARAKLLHSPVGNHKSKKPGKLKLRVKVPSYTNKVEYLKIEHPIDHDEYFLQLLINDEIISGINFEERHPNKNKEYADYEVLNSPEEFTAPYMLASFTVEDEKRFMFLCDLAADILIANPYPDEMQENIIHASLVNLKSKTRSDDLLLDWDEIDAADSKHIEIIRTLKNLEKKNIIKIEDLSYDLRKVDDNGKTNFKAAIQFIPSIPFNHKDCIKYGPIVLDKSVRQVFYPKISKKHITRFRTPNMYYRAFLMTLEKKEEPKIITDYELYQARYPGNKRPEKLTSKDKDEIEFIINYLKIKMHNHELYQRVDEGYKFTP